jgi:hypothetical protein
MVEPPDSGKMPGNRNPEWKILAGRNYNRRLWSKEKPESTITGNKKQTAKNGESGTLSLHRQETRPQQQ